MASYSRGSRTSSPYFIREKVYEKERSRRDFHKQMSPAVSSSQCTSEYLELDKLDNKEIQAQFIQALTPIKQWDIMSSDDFKKVLPKEKNEVFQRISKFITDYLKIEKSAPKEYKEACIYLLKHILHMCKYISILDDNLKYTGRFDKVLLFSEKQRKFAEEKLSILNPILSSSSSSSSSIIE